VTVDQLKREEEEKTSITPSTVVRWVNSRRVSYKLILGVVCWIALALILYSLKVLGFTDGR
jgi:hypothetical protein